MCKIQGELSSQNTFCLQDCSNISVEVSAKIRFSARKSHLNFYFISKEFPCFNFICCCVFITPPFREAGSLALSTHQTWERHRGEMTGHFGRPRVYIVGWDVRGTAQPFSNCLRGPGSRSCSAHSIAVVGGMVPAPPNICPHPSPPKL